MSHCGGHLTHLPVATFSKSYFEPRSRDRFSEADRYWTRWEVWLTIKQFDLGRACFLPLNGNAEAKTLECSIAWDPLYLHEICPVMPIARPQKQMLQRAIFREKNKTLTIGVQSSDGIHVVGESTVLCKRRPSLTVSELAENTERFVEDNILEALWISFFNHLSTGTTRSRCDEQLNGAPA